MLGHSWKEGQSRDTLDAFKVVRNMKYEASIYVTLNFFLHSKFNHPHSIKNHKATTYKPVKMGNTQVF